MSLVVVAEVGADFLLLFSVPFLDTAGLTEYAFSTGVAPPSFGFEKVVLKVVLVPFLS